MKKENVEAVVEETTEEVTVEYYEAETEETTGFWEKPAGKILKGIGKCLAIGAGAAALFALGRAAGSTKSGLESGSDDEYHEFVEVSRDDYAADSSNGNGTEE